MQLAALDPPPTNPIFRSVEGQTHGRLVFALIFTFVRLIVFFVRKRRKGSLTVRPSGRAGPSSSSLVELNRRVLALESFSKAEVSNFWFCTIFLIYSYDTGNVAGRSVLF